jgi:hypothetical protein
LRCTNCSSLMPFYAHPKDCDTKLMMQSIENVLNCVDLVYYMEILGGETFLNKKLNTIINKIVQHNNILQIDIITNGTVMPDQEWLSILKQDNICVVINDYGTLSRKKDSIKNVLINHGVKCRINKHWSWADLGGFESRGRNTDELTKLFQKCNFSNCTELLNGELHRCPRSSHGMNIGLIPRNKNDYVSVGEDGLDYLSLKKSIRTLISDKKYISSCNFCDGNTNDTLVLKPAKQNVIVE